MGPDDSAARTRRDPRLDVFRGLALFIILFAHIPHDPWSEAIPARFGFSDAAEIFVFCSGAASALAFGRTFDQAGLLRGTARIAHRIWQVYWAHVCVFVTVVGTLAWLDRHGRGDDHIGHALNLWPLLADPAQRLSEFATLTYVPNYFDILPMYMVILAMIPVAMLVERRLGGRAVLALSAVLWSVAFARRLELQAEPWGAGRPWFFNPFSWQFVFFLGFAFSRGWLAAPRSDWRAVAAAVVIVVAAAPFACHYGWSCYAGYGLAPWLGRAHDALAGVTDKTHLGPLRILHFLALAYLADRWAGPAGARLADRPGVSLVALVGRQALAVFLASLWIAQVLGVVLDGAGRDVVTVAVVNLVGCVALVAVALVVDWFKTGPWRSGAKVAARDRGEKVEPGFAAPSAAA